MTNSRTPWGPLQHAEQIAPGVAYLSAAGHGGLSLTTERWMALPEEVRETMLNPKFAEEDCEASIVLALLDLEPEQGHLDRAIRTAENFNRYRPALPHLEARKEPQTIQIPQQPVNPVTRETSNQ